MTTSSSSSLFHAICVVELPPILSTNGRRLSITVPSTTPTPTSSNPPTPTSGKPGTSSSSSWPGNNKTVLPQPRFVLILPHGDVNKIDRNVLSFCFPDTDHIARSPFHYEHTTEEYVFTLTRKDAPKLYGFCRRYRVGSTVVGGRLDISSLSSNKTEDITSAPLFQCICILSERPYHRFFSHCLQLLHTGRLAGGPVAMRIAKTLLSFNSAAPGAIIPLRSLIPVPQIPGSLQLPKERLRVPPSVGLNYFDVPLAPLLSRLDAPALLALYTAMLCERRILFISQSLSILTSCIHAAIALLQPFEWQHIFVPVLHTPLLQFTCAPNPYIIGVTPSQFTAVNELYEIGEITLIALDDGYVVTLNGALPLIDLEGNTSHNNGTGVITYSGPKVSQERAAVKVASAGLNNISAASVLLATDAPVDLSMTATNNIPSGTSTLGDVEATQASIGRRDGAALAASAAAALASNKLHTTTPTNTAAANAAAVALEAVLSPFHTYNRSHAYDEEVVFARAHRRAYINRRIRARTLARERVGLLFSKLVTPRPDNHTTGHESLSTVHNTNNDSIGRETSSSVLMPDDNIDMDSLVTHEHEESGTVSLAIDLVNLTSTPGFVNQRRRGPKRNSTNLSNLNTLNIGNDPTKSSSGGIKSLTAKMVSATMAGIAIATGSTSSCPGSRLAQEIKTVYARERKEGSWDEGAIYAAFLSFVAVVFGRITDFVYVEGTNDQAVRNGDVSPTTASLEPRFAKEEFVRYTVRHSTIAKLMEEAMNSQAIYTFACDYYLHTLTLRNTGTTNNGNTNVGTTTNNAAGKLNIIDLAMEAAIDPSLLSNPQNSIGANSLNTYNRSVNSTNTATSSNGLSYSSSNGSGPGGLLNNHVSFSNIHKKLSATLAVLYEPLLDAIPGSLGLNGNPNILSQPSLPPSSASISNNGTISTSSVNNGNPNNANNTALGTGIAGTAHTVATALSGLYYAGTCVTATSYRNPQPLPSGLAEAGMPLIVTALRTLLAAATTVGIQLDEPYTPSYIVRVAAAATHDPHLLHVVLGVLWSRLNDCTERHWQQGYKALALLYALLRVGSPRVAALAISYIPLLRFLIHPARIMAIRAGFAAETLSGQAESSTYIQCSNILSRNRRTMYTAGVTSIPGLNLSTTVHPFATIGPREGAHMVARQAARVYLLLANPRRWLLERAIAIGPACVSNGVPLTLPFPYPLINLDAVGAPGSSSLPPNWLPTPQQPIPPPYHETLAHANADGGNNTNAPPYMIIHKQPRAATAPFDQIHKVGTPAIASSLSKYLSTFANQYNCPVQQIIQRPTYIYDTVKDMKKKNEENNTGSNEGLNLTFRSMAEACRYPKAIHGHESIGKAGTPSVLPTASVLPTMLPVSEIAHLTQNADTLKLGTHIATTTTVPPSVPSRPPLAPRSSAAAVVTNTQTGTEASSIHPTHLPSNVGPTSSISRITAALPSPAPIKGPLHETFIPPTFSPPGTLLFSPSTNESVYSPSSVSTVSPSPSRPVRTNLQLDLMDDITSPPPVLSSSIVESPTDQLTGVNDNEHHTSNIMSTTYNDVKPMEYTNTPVAPVPFSMNENNKEIITETNETNTKSTSNSVPMEADATIDSHFVDGNSTSHASPIKNRSTNEPFTIDNNSNSNTNNSQSVNGTVVSSVSSTTSTDEFIGSLPGVSINHPTKAPTDDTSTTHNTSYVSRSTASSAPSTPPINGIAVPIFSGSAALPDPSGGLGTSRPRATSRPTIAEIFGPLQDRSPLVRSVNSSSAPTIEKSGILEGNTFNLNNNASSSTPLPPLQPVRTLSNGIVNNGPGAVPINTTTTSNSNNPSLPPRTPKLSSSNPSSSNIPGGLNNTSSPSFHLTATPTDSKSTIPPSTIPMTSTTIPSENTDDPFGFAQVALEGLSFVSPPPTITPLHHRMYRTASSSLTSETPSSLSSSSATSTVSTNLFDTTDGNDGGAKDKSTIDPFDLFDTFLTKPTSSNDNTNPFASPKEIGTGSTTSTDGPSKKNSEVEDPFALF